MGISTPPLRAEVVTSQQPDAFRPGQPVDVCLFLSVLALLVVGTIAIFSSSALYATNKYDTATFFLKRHLVWMSLGFFAMYCGANTNYAWLRRWTYALLAGALLMLVAVLVVGKEINSAKRWFSLGPLSVQPVEIAKLALVAYLANSLSRKGEKVKNFSVGFVPHLVVCAVMMILLLMQPDLGSCIILGATTMALLFVAGTKLSYLLGAVLIAAPVAYQQIVGTPWRMKRFLAFFNPDAYQHGVGYQVAQSRIAIGSGGVFGTGLGEGKQQLGYMIEGHNDFILSCIGEEMGLIGIGLVLCLFFVVLWRGISISMHSRDVFGSYLAFGITFMLSLQALINAGVVMGALPAKGLTLPFVSYGGSSLIVAMYSVGILINIAKRQPEVVRKKTLVNRIASNRRRPKVHIIVD